jgi:hypothetical protein
MKTLFPAPTLLVGHPFPNVHIQQAKRRVSEKAQNHQATPQTHPD